MSSHSVPPDLFPLIASFIPLRSARQTLLSLALGNHDFYNIVHPILYSRLVLGNEDDAISVIQKILDDPQLGVFVTELYIMADLSAETREGKKPFDVTDGLQKLIRGKHLPRLTALGVYLMNGWEYDDEWNPILSHGRIEDDFWSSLHAACPRLQNLILRNLGHNDEDQWFSGSVLDKIMDMTTLSTLRLEWIGQGLSESDSLKVLNRLPQLASSLHTLSLHASSQELDMLVNIDFPSLKWLRLQDFLAYPESNLMAFCRRHPQLESISFLNTSCECFSGDVEDGFLPNLKHLKANFADIRRLAPILPQLVSLSFTESFNCQVPYLLRAVLPNGLPRLKSLEIEQSVTGWDLRKVEGVLWYETLDGRFHTETRRKKVERDFTTDYMHSIVRGAPQLEELGLRGIPLDPKALKKIGQTLPKFECLTRFYYNGFSTFPNNGYVPPKEEHDQLLAEFLSSAEALARACTLLERVTSNSARYLPYVSCIIKRDSTGEVIGVRRNDSVAMELSAEEDDPFPYHSLF